MSDFLEFTGKTTEEALHKAGAHFDLPLSRLEVEVVSAGSSGLFGILGAKKAKVRVRPFAGSGLEAEMAELAAVVSEGVRPRTPRPSAPPAEAPPAPQPTPAPPVTVPAPTPPAVPEPEPPRAAAPVVTPQPAPAPEAVATPAFAPAPLPEHEDVEEVELAEDAGLLVEGEDEALEAGEEISLGLEDEAEGPADQRLEQDPSVIAHAQEVLARLVAPLDPSAQVSAQSSGQGIELAVQGQDVGVLIGRRGQNLEALQYLVTRIVSHRCGRPVRVVVDAGEYRRRRREALEEMARRMAQKARQTGKPVAVGPLTAQERRVVHLTLKGEAGLTTSSRGRGELKKVVISPR